MVTIKLSYQNRKIEGEKLAQVIRKDLLKRHRPKQQTARDASLDLVTTGKALGAHFDLVCEGLLAAITNGAIRLGQLEVSDNGLPTCTLLALAQVVRASAQTLQQLDLSKNNLCVETDMDLRAWSAFVAALSSCSALQIVDLSCNPLGDKAAETLARFYCKVSTRLSGLTGAAHTPTQDVKSVFDTAIDHEYETIMPPRQIDLSLISQTMPSPLQRGDDPELNDEETAAAGLRGLSYLCLAQTTFTDAGALFLSYLVEHRRAEQVIDYADNDFSVAASRLLEAAEHIKDLHRHHVSKADTTSSDEDEPLTASGVPTPVKTSSHAHAIPRKAFIITPGRRRSSVDPDAVLSVQQFARRASEDEHATEVLERARTKIQGYILKNHTESSLPIELWRATLMTIRLGVLMIRGRSPQRRCARMKLSLALWQRILMPVTDPHDALSDCQKARALDFAASAQAQEASYPLNGKLPHVRIWHLLDSLKCLSYDFRA